MQSHCTWYEILLGAVIDIEELLRIDVEQWIHRALYLYHHTVTWQEGVLHIVEAELDWSNLTWLEWHRIDVDIGIVDISYASSVAILAAHDLPAYHHLAAGHEIAAITIAARGDCRLVGEEAVSVCEVIWEDVDELDNKVSISGREAHVELNIYRTAEGQWFSEYLTVDSEYVWTTISEALVIEHIGSSTASTWH